MTVIEHARTPLFSSFFSDTQSIGSESVEMQGPKNSPLKGSQARRGGFLSTLTFAGVTSFVLSSANG